MDPHFRRMQQSFDKVRFLRVDSTTDRSFAEAAGVDSDADLPPLQDSTARRGDGRDRLSHIVEERIWRITSLSRFFLQERRRPLRWRRASWRGAARCPAETLSKGPRPGNGVPAGSEEDTKFRATAA